MKRILKALGLTMFYFALITFMLFLGSYFPKIIIGIGMLLIVGLIFFCAYKIIGES